MDVETIITATHLSKAYRLYQKPFDRVREAFSPFRRCYHQDFYALNNVSFQIYRGETVGIIGRNGSGKSTLLKILTGLVNPTSGSVEVDGKVSALLELGAGFNPEMTGYENVFLTGVINGLSRDQVEARLDDILAFADIGEFIDQPVKTYSSGMQVRLAFSVATAFRPDLLIVDEALTVGDSYFQHKSFDRIRRFRDTGVSIMLVSHAMGDVRTLCDRVILLDKGRVIKDGLPDEVLDYYNALTAEKENAKPSVEQRREKSGWLLTKSGTGEARVKALQLLDASSGKELAVAHVGQEVELQMEASIHADIPRLVLGYMIRDKQGRVVWGTNTWHTHQIQENIRSGESVTFKLRFDCTLGPGSYSVSPALVSSDTHLINNYEWIDNLLVFDVVNTDCQFFIGSNWLNAGFTITRKMPGGAE
jgi:lipopolysaccharide transport system ATP-binding protein